MLWLIVPGILLALGLILFITGMRGRKVNDHPICRGCRFDLVGIYPGSSRCPECGKELDGSAIRVGKRKRRPWLAISGAMLAVTSLLAGGSLIVIDNREYDWAYFVPTSWLIARIGDDESGTDGRIIGELYNRHEFGTLTQTQMDEIAAITLKRQADLSLDWHRRSGALMERLIAFNDISPTDASTYFEQIQVEIVVQTVSKARTDATIPIAVAVTLDRTGFGDFFYEYTLNSLMIDDIAVARPEFQSERTRYQLPQLSWFDFSDDKWRDLEITNWTLPVPVGAHTIRTSWTMRAFNSIEDDAELLLTRELEASTPIEVVPTGIPIILPVFNENLAEVFMRSGWVESAQARHLGDDRVEFDLELVSSGNRKIPISMQAVLIDGSQEWVLGSFAMRPAYDRERVTLSSILTGFESHNATLELRPDPELAEQMLGFDRILSNTISFEVTIQWAE